MKFKDNLKLIGQYLPFSIKPIAEKLPRDIQEIRLRVNQPIALCSANKNYFVKNNLDFCDSLCDDLIYISQKELYECFNTICNYSVYSKHNEIINGYITLKGGNRAGICGTSIMQDDKIINIRDITSINIRVCCERTGCGQKLSESIDASKGVLLCGAPCSGKTTILRDMARILSYKYKTTLIDSRSELAAVYAGIPQNDVGLCDVLNSYSKTDGFSQAVRCLSPELIICDELGGAEDSRSIVEARKSGVSVISSAHCQNKEELNSKPFLNSLIKTGCFENIVFINSGAKVGQVREILNTNELL